MRRRKHLRPFPNNHDQLGLIGSLAIHVVLLFLLLKNQAPHPPPVSTIDVTVEPASAIANRPQIVSPSEQPEAPPLDTTNRLSDKDSRAEVEQVRRGDGGGIPGAKASDAQPSKAQPANAKTRETREVKEPQPKEMSDQKERAEQEPKEKRPQRELKLNDLKLDDETIALKFGNKPKNPTSSPQSANAEPQKSLSDYQAFSRPPGSGAAFFGSAGISDHLPNLPDGDITLLNAKANIYASFVRRVAIQVFTQLRSQGWESLSAAQIRQLSGFATVEAVLSPDGKFMRAKLVESSGSESFDIVLHTSASRGSGDPNPPPGAQAKDGLIHFIFKARSWSQVGMNRRTGAPVEQRWLLLATGLE